MADYNVILGTNTADGLIVSNTSGEDSLALLAGNDTVTGSGGIDIVDFGSGNDLLTQPGAYTGGTLIGGTGNDTFYFGDKVSGTSADGGNNNDSIMLVKTTGTFSANTLAGALSNDTINIASGTTLLNSSVYGGSASVTSNDGADSIVVGTVSASLLQGNAGNDTFNIQGTSTDATIRGGASDDNINQVGSIGLSYVSGNLGGDTLMVTGAVSANTSVWGGGANHTTDDSADSELRKHSARCLGSRQRWF